MLTLLNDLGEKPFMFYVGREIIGEKKQMKHRPFILQRKNGLYQIG